MYAVLFIPIGWLKRLRADRFYDSLERRGAVRDWNAIELALREKQSFLLFRSGAGKYPEVWWTQIDVLRQFEQQENVILDPLAAWTSRKFKKWV